MCTREMPAFAMEGAAATAGPPWVSTPSPLARRWEVERDRHSGLHATVLAEEEDGTVRLEGSVRTQYLKQVALAVVVELAGSRRIINAIRVVPHARRSEANGGENERS